MLRHSLTSIQYWTFKRKAQDKNTQKWPTHRTISNEEDKQRNRAWIVKFRLKICHDDEESRNLSRGWDAILRKDRKQRWRDIRVRRNDARTRAGARRGWRRLAHDEDDNNDFSSATTGLTWGMRWRTTLRGYVTTHETNISELSGFVANLDRASRAKPRLPDLANDSAKECRK